MPRTVNRQKIQISADCDLEAEAKNGDGGRQTALESHQGLDLCDASSWLWVGATYHPPKLILNRDHCNHKGDAAKMIFHISGLHLFHNQ